MRGDRYHNGSRSALHTDSSRCSQDLRDANEIVGGCDENEEPFDQCAPAMSGLTQAAHGLHPTERLFDLFSLDRADAMTGMAGRARVDRRAAVGVVLRHMRGAAARAAAGDEIGRVIVFVA